MFDTLFVVFLFVRHTNTNTPRAQTTNQEFPMQIIPDWGNVLVVTEAPDSDQSVGLIRGQTGNCAYTGVVNGSILD